MQQKFTRREVIRSFRKFNDLAQDLFSAQYQGWGGCFNNLIEHCKQDSVMKVVIEPLKNNTNVDAEGWYENVLDSQTSGVGSGNYDLPYDDDERTALLYQLFLFMSDEEKSFSLSKFNMVVFGRSRYQEMTDLFNREIVSKFTREVSYRLEEILEDVGDKEEISREAMHVFHYHDNSMNINNSNLEANNLAANNSQIVNSSAQLTKQVTQIDLLEALRQARESIQSLPEKEQGKAEVFIDTIEEDAKSGKELSPTALGFMASLYPILEHAGTALDVLEKFKNLMNGK